MPAPLLVAFKGHPGVGKTTVIDALACELTGLGIATTIISKDAHRDALDREKNGTDAPALNARANAAAVTAAGKALAGAAAAAAAATTLNSDDPAPVVILDTTLSSEALFRDVLTAAGPSTGRVLVVEVVCGGDAEWDRRLRARAAEAGASGHSHKPESLEAVRSLIDGYGGSHEWVQRRVTDGHQAAHPPGGGVLSPPTRLALPWKEAGIDRAEPGLYMCVNNNSGGVGDIVQAIVAVVRSGEV